MKSWRKSINWRNFFDFIKNRTNLKEWDIKNSDYELECTCGSPNCRKIITSQDWKIKELQDKYYDYFAEHLKEKIKKEREK